MKKLLKASFIFLLLFVLRLDAQALQANLSWSAVTTFSDGTSIPSGTTVNYDVYRATQASLANAIKLNGAPITTTTFSDLLISTGNTYYYFVRSYINSALPSSNSNVVIVITLVPSAPTGLTGTVSP